MTECSRGDDLNVKGKEDPFEQMNALFLDTYSCVRDRLTQRSLPIILTDSDRVVLYSASGREERRLDMRKYHQCKTIAHVPVTAGLLCEAWQQENEHKDDKDDTVQHLQRLVERCHELSRLLVQPIELEPSLVAAMMAILQRTIEFAQQIVHTGRVTQPSYTDFAATCRQDIKTLIARAAVLAIAAFDEHVLPWRDAMKAEEWEKLHVVVHGVPQARKQALPIQYFENLLHVQKEDRSRVLYVENIMDFSAGLQAIGVVLLDRKLSRAFFSENDKRLEKDVLAVETKLHLRRASAGQQAAAMSQFASMRSLCDDTDSAICAHSQGVSPPVSCDNALTQINTTS